MEHHTQHGHNTLTVVGAISLAHIRERGSHTGLAGLGGVVGLIRRACRGGSFPAPHTRIRSVFFKQF